MAHLVAATLGGIKGPGSIDEGIEFLLKLVEVGDASGDLAASLGEEVGDVTTLPSCATPLEVQAGATGEGGGVSPQINPICYIDCSGCWVTRWRRWVV